MRLCYCCCSENILFIDNIKLSLVNDIFLNDNLSIYYCKTCNFYYSDSNNNENDYNIYYNKFNNYKKNIVYSDKDERCNLYLRDKLKSKNIINILDYGSGNGVLKELLSNEYNIDEFDIGMEKNEKKYDCLILSHVLGHIYDINKFIQTISLNIKENGLLYIEIPNAEYYNKMQHLGPLQEITIEHINFFSKYALNKLLLLHNYYTVSIEDDYFIVNNKYYIIRGIFSKNKENTSFTKYIENGVNKINKYNFEILKRFENIYIYGCGQFLFKIFNNIIKYTNVINIIDDNSCYYDKYLGNIEIINYDTYKEKSGNGDVILLTSIIHDKILKNKIKLINKNINIIYFTENIIESEL